MSRFTINTAALSRMTPDERAEHARNIINAALTGDLRGRVGIREAADLSDAIRGYRLAPSCRLIPREGGGWRCEPLALGACFNA